MDMSDNREKLQKEFRKAGANIGCRVFRPVGKIQSPDRSITFSATEGTFIKKRTRIDQQRNRRKVEYFEKNRGKPPESSPYFPQKSYD